MDMSEFHYPTQGEIEAQIRLARKLQAEALSDMVKAAGRWLTHPRFSHRHA